MAVNPAFGRLAMLIGDRAADALAGTKVHVFGLGGVGSFCAEALARSGVGSITLIDHDVVDVSNINRQVEATVNTIGQTKTAALTTRLNEINPYCRITPITKFFIRGEDVMENTAELFGIDKTDYVIDAIDSLNSKLDLIESAARSEAVLFSSMGMAGKLDPTRLKTAGIWETSGCPLARSVREGLRKRGFAGNFTVVYSDENRAKTGEVFEPAEKGRKPLGSAVPVTAAAGMILASLVIRDICGRNNG